MRPPLLVLSVLLATTCASDPVADLTTSSGDTSTTDATSGTTTGATTSPTTTPTTGATTAVGESSVSESTASSTGVDAFDCGTVQCAANELCFGYSSDVCMGDEAGECRPLPPGCTKNDLCSPACARLCAHYTCPESLFGCVPGYACFTGCDEQADCSLPGTACKGVSLDGNLSWDESHCVPTPPRPAAPGEPCTTIEDGEWIWDTCAPGAVCVSIDEDTKQGVCAPQCMLVDTPACDPCVTYGRRLDDDQVYFCPPTCDPLASTCASNEVCVANGKTAFICVKDASNEGGAIYEPCEYVNGCDTGLACMAYDSSPLCDPNENYCCLPLCDLDAPVCPDGLPCEPWYPQGEAPDGLEDVGVCAVVP